MECERMLDRYIAEFGKEYDVPTNRIWIEFMGTEQLGKDILGMTWFKHNEDRQTICKIGVSSLLSRHTYSCRSVAWHEFCHAESWIKYERAEQHGKEWRKRVMRKPILYILGTFISGVMYHYERLRIT